MCATTTKYSVDKSHLQPVRLEVKSFFVFGPNFNLLIEQLAGDQPESCQQHGGLPAARDPAADRRELRLEGENRDAEREHQAPQASSQNLHEKVDRCGR